MEGYWAHSANRCGVKHTLADHLAAVASLTRRAAEKFGAGELGYWAGWWHDLGKFHPDFASYLESPEAQRGPDHSTQVWSTQPRR